MTGGTGSMTFVQEPGIPDTLIGDPLRLTQVLVNLLDNGIKFTKQGGTSLRVYLEKPPESAQVKLGFSISDTGIGMTEEQIAGVFIPFSQVDSSLTRKYGGVFLYNTRRPYLSLNYETPENMHRRVAQKSVTLFQDLTPEAS